MTKPFAWSYSLLQAFETCPRRFKLTRITKEVQEPQSEAMLHGNMVHKALELRVKDSTPLPAKYAQYAPMMDAIMAAPGVKHPEQRFGLTRDFQPCEFFAPNVWVRGVLDLSIVRENSVIELDYKTGKPKSDGDQLKLCAAASFARHPNARTVHTGYLWLAHNRVDTSVFQRTDVPAIWQDFIPRVERVVRASATGEYPPIPSGLCKNWCPVRKAQCEFSGKQ